MEGQRRSPYERGRAALEELLDATGTGWRAVLVGTVLVGALVGAAWWLTRQVPVPVDAALPMVEPAAVTTTTEPPGPIVVHVAGAVARPGVQELAAGARVIDAVEAAGGLTADADGGRVNLAAAAEDGTQVYVPAVGEMPTDADGAPGGGAAAAEVDDGIVDVNTADATQLEALPGVGPSTAAAIIDHREANGPFAAVEGLLEVRGIGEAKLAQMRDLVRV